MKEIKTYINKNAFQFITDFSSHTYITNRGEQAELNFGELTIYERIILSSILTLFCKGETDYTPKDNIYNFIFNFNKNKNRTSYYDSFLKEISNFIENKPYFITYIKEYYNEIVDGKTKIYRQQITSAEMEILNQLKFQKNYKSLMNVLYILGVAKQNKQTKFLNKINLTNFYPTSVSMSKKRVKEVFDKLSSASEEPVLYTIENNMVYFTSTFKLKKHTKKKLAGTNVFDTIKKNKETESESESEPEPEPEPEPVAQIVEEPETQIVEEKTEGNSVNLNLGEGHFTMAKLFNKIFDNDYPTEYCKKIINKHCKNDYNKKLVLANTVNETFDFLNVLRKGDEFSKFVTNPNHRFNGDDWREKKDECKSKLNDLEKQTLKTFEQIYLDLKEKDNKLLVILCEFFNIFPSFVTACLNKKC